MERSMPSRMVSPFFMEMVHTIRDWPALSLVKSIRLMRAASGLKSIGSGSEHWIGLGISASCSM